MISSIMSFITDTFISREDITLSGARAEKEEDIFSITMSDVLSSSIEWKTITLNPTVRLLWIIKQPDVQKAQRAWMIISKRLQIPKGVALMVASLICTESGWVI